MKKYLFLLIAAFLLVCCTEDIKFNNPAFQMLKDNVFWRAQNYKAHIETNGVFIIEGSLGFEKVTFKIPSTSPKTYILGIDNITTATYSNILPGHSEEFTTGENRGNGQIIVTEYNVENQTISGTFKFNAINVDEEDLEKTGTNFTEGVFYKIPVSPNLEY